MTALGSPAHQALIAHVAEHYAGDDRIRAVAVFGSVGPAPGTSCPTSTSTW